MERQVQNKLFLPTLAVLSSQKDAERQVKQIDVPRPRPLHFFSIFYEQRFNERKPTGVTFTLYLVLLCLIQRKLKIERWGLLLDRDRRVDMIKFTLVSNASKLNFFKSKYCFF